MEYLDPFYRYDLSLLEQTITTATEEAKSNNISLYYAVKANNEQNILAKIKQAGLGIDAVTKEEIDHSLKNGFTKEQIVFAGSGKSVKEIEFALFQNIAVIHCESIEEFHIIKEIKEKLHSKTKIALRLNPDFEVDTNANIATGKNEHKFGLTLEEARVLINSHAEDIIGFHIHVGSQILDISYFEALSLHISTILQSFEGYTPNYLNLGGGLGVDYINPEKNPIPNFKDWMQAIRKHLPISKYPKLCLEPGRSLVAQCGKLIGQVQYIKIRNDQKIALLNVGMSDLIRPMLYGAYHKITSHNNSLEFDVYTISGPSCESTDVFHKNYRIEKLSSGDIIEIHSAGAYGSSMSLQYNMKERIPSVFINNSCNTSMKSQHGKSTPCCIK